MGRIPSTVCGDVQLVAEGLDFPEGPVALADGSVLVVEIRRGTLSRIDPEGVVTVVAETGGGPNGAAIGPDGAAYVCNNGGLLAHEARAPGCIQRVDLDTGAVDVLYAECDGRPLIRPNDLVFDRSGGFWFTDSGKTTAREVVLGAIYYAVPDGSSITRAVDGVDHPNGIGLSPDEDALYWAQTRLRQVIRRGVRRRGELVPSIGIELRNLAFRGEYDAASLLVGLPGNSQLDSLAVEAGGSVCVGTLLDGAITVVSPDGSSVERMTLPAPFSDVLVTNICFGGDDMRTAYLTLSATGRLVSCRWPRAGHRLAFQGRTEAGAG